MVPKKNKLVLKKGVFVKHQHRWDHRSLTLFYSDSKSEYRIGVIVGKKIDKRATVRNKIKRQIYTICLDLFQNRSLALLVITKPPIKDLDFGQIKQIFIDFSQQLKSK